MKLCRRPRRKIAYPKLNEIQFCKAKIFLGFCLYFALVLSQFHVVNSFVTTKHIASQYQCRLTNSSSSALLGIKGFRAWFETTFPNAMISPISPSNGDHDEFDHVLVDLNQILVSILEKKSVSSGVDNLYCRIFSKS